MQYLYLGLTGLVTGVMSGTFGIGGGIILVPILVMIFKFPQYTANGTSLAAMLLPVGAFGVWEYYREGMINNTHVIAGLIIAVGILAGTFLGARFAMSLPEQILKRAFALFLVAVAIKFWVSAGES